ncbi:CsgG/HfaB family protein [Stieleria varia]|uniref:Curli production assembly/transport component CsgG n=1 Tax=Stieleria varia TaxID=2528005 RepID=A0A5C6A0E7_9BACT|nr:CsgG/HfaB family protein [Stieleria varia]TWT92790.1 Curli production assembly/transport component CsgG [Stieleria varia]
MFNTRSILCAAITLVLAFCGHLSAAEPKLPVSAAILPFESRGDVAEQAAQVTQLLLANLITSESVMLVERQAIDEVFEELKLSKSGAVKASDAVRVGELSGAKLLITGSVLQVNGDLYLIAKVIGTETSRLAGASVKGAENADLGTLVEQLAAEINQVVAQKAESILPKTISVDDWIQQAKKTLKGKKLPSVTVAVTEQHLGQQTFDPAAQTEMERLLTELGFNVIASDSAAAIRADILIKGEALSQFATSRSDLVSVKCRVETQVTHQADGNVLTSDSETTMSIGLAEQLAAKQGLQDAAQQLVKRLIAKLVK